MYKKCTVFLVALFHVCVKILLSTTPCAALKIQIWTIFIRMWDHLHPKDLLTKKNTKKIRKEKFRKIYEKITENLWKNYKKLRKIWKNLEKIIKSLIQTVFPEATTSYDVYFSNTTYFQTPSCVPTHLYGRYLHSTQCWSMSSASETFQEHPCSLYGQSCLVVLTIRNIGFGTLTKFTDLHYNNL